MKIASDSALSIHPPLSPRALSLNQRCLGHAKLGKASVWHFQNRDFWSTRGHKISYSVNCVQKGMLVNIAKSVIP